MAFYHITAAKRKLAVRLGEELPARLVAADLLADDGVVTEPPYEIHTTDKADLGGLPSLELIVTDSTPQVDSFVQMYRHRVVIGVSCGGDTEEIVTTQVERYIWCMRAIVRDLHLVPIEGTGPVDTGGEQYTPLQQRPETVERPFVRGAFLEVFVTTVE
jgi:hypothetical protein